MEQSFPDSPQTPLAAANLMLAKLFSNDAALPLARFSLDEVVLHAMCAHCLQLLLTVWQFDRRVPIRRGGRRLRWHAAA